MKLLKLSPMFFLALLLTACGGGAADSGSAGSTHEALDGDQLLNEFRGCEENRSGPKDCKTLAAKAICGTCQIGDFVKTEQPREYIDYEAIAGVILQSGAWSALGDADEQAVLDEAQQLANSGKCVIGINTTDGQSNVAWILPGEQTKSNSWGVNCPNSASFIPHSPDYSYVGKTLNYAWKSPAGVILYARK